MSDSLGESNPKPEVQNPSDATQSSANLNPETEVTHENNGTGSVSDVVDNCTEKDTTAINQSVEQLGSNVSVRNTKKDLSDTERNKLSPEVNGSIGDVTKADDTIQAAGDSRNKTDDLKPPKTGESLVLIKMSEPDTGSEGKVTCHEEKPYWFCKLITEHSTASFVFFTCCHIVTILLSAILLLAGFDLLPTNFTDVPLNLNNHDTYLRSQAWLYRDNPENEIIPRINNNTIGVPRSDIYQYVQVIFYYEDKNKNIFTPENIAAIKGVEEEIFALPNFGNFCLIHPLVSCHPPVSVIRLFDGSYASSVSPLFLDPTLANIVPILNAAANSPLNDLLNFVRTKDSIITPEKIQNEATRIAFALASPLKGYLNPEDRNDEQEDKLDEFLYDVLKPKLHEIRDRGTKDMKMVFINKTIIKKDLLAQVIKDLMLAIGSFLFIIIFMGLQTRSVFITGLALFSVIGSFCWANLLYRIVFDFRYFGVFQVLAVFIILGIGADDIFVFYDTWRHFAVKPFPSIAHRLTHCYSSAGSSMLVTSLTTMLAFIVNAFSPLLALSSFGLFSGLLIFVNYFSAITYFPSVVVFHHIRFATKGCCMSSNAVQEIGSDEQDKSASSLVVKVSNFAKGPFYNLIAHKILRFIILVVFIGIVGLFTYYASTLKTEQEPVKFVSEDTNFGKGLQMNEQAFIPSSLDNDIVAVRMIWGLRNHDRDNCHKTDFRTKHCKGKSRWYNSLDMNSLRAQKVLKDFCDYLTIGMTDEQASKLRIRKTPHGVNDVKCFIQSMNTFYQGEQSKALYNGSVALTIPQQEEHIKRFMASHPTIYQQPIDILYHRFFETTLDYWLYGGYSSPMISSDLSTYSTEVGAIRDVFDTSKIRKTALYSGTRLRYMAITVKLNFKMGTVSYKKGLDLYQEWENFFEEQRQQMPASLSDGFQCTPSKDGDSAERNSWHWFHIQETLTDSALLGIYIGLSCSLVVITLATQNVILGFIATLVIGSTTATIIGLMPMLGWKLGVIESLNLSLVVGLSVDYVVHLALAYNKSKSSDRSTRTQDMLEGTAISIVSGAISTLGASCFLLGAQILFFRQFGVFMFCTIGFSLLYSLILFSTTMALCGPQGNTGSFRGLLCRVFYRNSGTTGLKKNEEV